MPRSNHTVPGIYSTDGNNSLDEDRRHSVTGPIYMSNPWPLASGMRVKKSSGSIRCNPAEMDFHIGLGCYADILFAARVEHSEADVRSAVWNRSNSRQ